VELIPSGKQMVGIGQTSRTDANTTQAQLVFTFPCSRALAARVR